MGKKYQKMSILDTYKSVEERLENNKAEPFVLLDEHLCSCCRYMSRLLLKIIQLSMY